MAGSHLLTTASPYHRPSHHQQRQSSLQYSLSTQDLLKTNAAVFAVAAALVQALPEYVPGFKTSATFLSSLRANLCITDYDDCTETDACPATFSKAEIQNLAEISGVVTAFADSAADKQAAQRLIRDSVAQQQQTAAQSLLTHPTSIAALAILAAIIYQCLRWFAADDNLFLAVMSGMIMASFAFTQLLTNDYVKLADKTMRSSWLGDDLLLITKYGEKVVGAVVLRWDTSNTSRGRGRSRRAFKGTVRAWAVSEKYRGIGEGRTLLEQAASYIHTNGGETMEFEADGIYSQRVLPKLYNSVFDQRDDRAQIALDQVLSREFPVSRRRNSY